MYVRSLGQVLGMLTAALTHVAMAGLHRTRGASR
jgi:hypothetical protein